MSNVGLLCKFGYSTTSLLLSVSLSYYLYFRWSHMSRNTLTNFSIFYLLSETIILIIGWMNLLFLLLGSVLVILNDIEKMDDGKEETNLFHVVTVLIPTYNEPIDILRRTLSAVESIRYPRGHIRVIVGDDQKRQTVREMIEQEFPTVVYHTRQSIVGHAKAGNINDMVRHAVDPETEYLLIMDCDMAPEPNILENMVPFFYKDNGERDEKCAFIQSPQHFENLRGVIDFLGQQYHFFYKIVLPAYGAFSSGPPCCGTNVLFDVSILSSIGGLQYGSITEDFNTSLLLHSQGYHSKYCVKKTAVGFAPSTLLDFFHQRGRWTTGGLQIVFSTSAYRRSCMKLSWSHRWIYFFSGAAPVLSVFMIILMLGPLMDLMGIRFFDQSIDAMDYFYSFLPYATMYIMCLIWLHRTTGIVIFLTCIVESIFMVPFQFYYCFNFVIRHMCGFQHIRFRSFGYQRFRFITTPKPQISSALLSTSSDYWEIVWNIIDTLSLLTPYLAYIATGISLLVSYRNTDVSSSTYIIDFFWLLFIMVQFLPPVLYVFQNIILYGSL